MHDQLDFLAIGDITIDAFIQLSEKDARVLKDERGRQQLQMSFGDKLPYEDVTVVNAVGNAPNASVSAHRLGLKSALATNLGGDRNGKDCLRALRDESVRTDYVRVHENRGTNYHYVLRLGAERTILIKHEEYPYVLPDLPTPPRYIYFSSIGENGVPFHHDVARYVAAHPETKLVFQPGTFQIRLGAETLRDLYAVTEIFFCNKEEAQRILHTDEENVPTLLREFRELGPKMPVITDGPNGAYALDGDRVWLMPMYPDPAPPVDRTGAGDSFSSTFTAAIALGHDVKTALSWGPINSMSVVQHIGAQKGLLTEDALREHLKDAPANYTPEQIA
jgi:sugar/nucleoside kinase (ribokinase family)